MRPPVGAVRAMFLTMGVRKTCRPPVKGEVDWSVEFKTVCDCRVVRFLGMSRRGGRVGPARWAGGTGAEAEPTWLGQKPQRWRVSRDDGTEAVPMDDVSRKRRSERSTAVAAGVYATTMSASVL